MTRCVRSLTMRQLCHGWWCKCFVARRNTLQGRDVLLYLLGENKGEGLDVINEGRMTAGEHLWSRITITFSFTGSRFPNIAVVLVWRGASVCCPGWLACCGICVCWCPLVWLNFSCWVLLVCSWCNEGGLVACVACGRVAWVTCSVLLFGLARS